MSSNESEKPREEKPSQVDMRAALLPQGPAEVDIRATASAPPPVVKPEPTPEFAAAPDVELEAALAAGFDTTGEAFLETPPGTTVESTSDVGLESLPEVSEQAAVEGTPDLSATADFAAVQSELVAPAEGEAPAAAPEDLDATTEFVSLGMSSVGAAAAGGAAAEGSTSVVAAASGAELLTPAGEEAVATPEEEAAPEEEKEPTPGLFERIAAHINAYDLLLGVAFVALAVGTLCLAYELSNYQWDTRARAGRQPVSSLAPARDAAANLAARELV